jgi:hypothetical protein
VPPVRLLHRIILVLLIIAAVIRVGRALLH